MMTGFWWRITLSPLQLGMIGVLSAAATAMVVVAGLGRTPAQSAALAALRTRPQQIHVSAPAATLPATAAPVSPAPAPGTATVPVSTPAPTAASSPATSAVPASASTAASTPATIPAASPRPAPRPKFRHVFVLALTTSSYDAAFGTASVAHYLNHKLVPKGTVLGGYESLGGAELPDYLAMISGQAPNPDTSGDCPAYDDFPAGSQPDSQGLVPGAGCVYPNTVLTIGDQVTAAGHSWRAYIDGMGTTSCLHPDSGGPTATPPTGAGPDYSLLHNPFVYFHSLLDLGSCATDDVSLDQLPRDLSRPATAPTFAFIAPGACLDAAVSTCASGGPAGLEGEDAFLRTWVPRILHSKAYRDDGALIITFALPGPSQAQSASTPAGSAPVGALLLAPHAARGKIVSTAFNPYSVLKSVEQLLRYKPLGKAGSARSFADLLG
jgi:hypothetical protein